jgi:hypothetical protein
MSQKIEFTCPSCHTPLRVPIEMVGVSGPCPTCRSTIIAPHPQLGAQQPMVAPNLDTAYREESSPLRQGGAPQQSGSTQSYQPATQHLQAGALPPNRPLGETPHQQRTGSAADPRAFNATGDSGVRRENTVAPVNPVRPKRRIWPAIVFPLLFIGLTVAVIYLILDMMNVFEPEVQPTEPGLTPNESITTKAPPTVALPVKDPQASPPVIAIPPGEVIPDSLEGPKELKHNELDVNTPDEVPTKLPLTAKKINEIDAELELLRQARIKKTRFIVACEGVLKQFLSAKTFEERLPFMTKSRRSPEELSSSCLAGPLPKIIISRPETSFTPSGRVMDSYHSVAFDAPSEERKSRIISMRLVSFAENEPPRVQTDAFLDLYEGHAGKFAEKPVKGPLTVHAVVKVSSFCLVEGIPDADSKATVSLLQNVTVTSNIIAKAFLRAESDTFKKLRSLIRGDSYAAVTLTLAWNTTEDPTKPYLEVVRLNSLNWSVD